MIGNISLLNEGRYGFILGNDGNEYYFNNSHLRQCDWSELNEGDAVSFEWGENDKGKYAYKVNLYYGKTFEYYACDEGEGTYPGIHSMVDLSSFDEEERAIVKTLGKTFYVSNRGQTIVLGKSSKFRFFLVKPTDFFGEQFNMNREIIVILSNYDKFEPRTFDAIARAFKLIGQPLRIDRICSIVVSKDDNVTSKVKEYLKSDVEMQVIIPFKYAELKSGDKSQLIIKRFKEYFYSRDLFAFESPLKKDIYFFGRREYVHTLVNRHKSGENSGVFGLRRSGKTSVLEAIIRASELIDTACVFIDCQNLYHFSWNRALFNTINKIALKIGLDTPTDEEDYTEEDANWHFEEDLELLLANTECNVLLLYDEIEHISPQLGMSKNWKTEDDFIKYWQTIRSNYRKHGNRFTFILAGTNPSAIEMITINGHDNPLFNQLNTESYLPAFSVEATKEMVNKLGGYMGLEFDDIVCANLTKDFGGHPYLIRHFCSEINNYTIERNMSRPINVTTSIYNAVMPIFVQRRADNYCRLITNVLYDYYPEEYRFLEDLALGNLSDYECFDPTMLGHLIGYGIIEDNQGVLDYKIDVLKNYMSRKNAYKKMNMTLEEKWQEISERRNRIEPKLRQIIKNVLKQSCGETIAKEKVLESIRYDNRDKYKNLNYYDLFNPDKSEIYFSQLGKLISDNWNQGFNHVFSKNRNTIRSYFNILNDLRKECHAAQVTDDEMQSFRGAIGTLEKDVKSYFGE